MPPLKKAHARKPDEPDAWRSSDGVKPSGSSVEPAGICVRVGFIFTLVGSVRASEPKIESMPRLSIPKLLRMSPK